MTYKQILDLVDELRITSVGNEEAIMALNYTKKVLTSHQERTQEATVYPGARNTIRLWKWLREVKHQYVEGNVSPPIGALESTSLSAVWRRILSQAERVVGGELQAAKLGLTKLPIVVGPNVELRAPMMMYKSPEESYSIANQVTKRSPSAHAPESTTPPRVMDHGVLNLQSPNIESETRFFSYIIECSTKLLNRPKDSSEVLRILPYPHWRTVLIEFFSSKSEIYRRGSQ